MRGRECADGSAADGSAADGRRGRGRRAVPRTGRRVGGAGVAFGRGRGPVRREPGARAAPGPGPGAPGAGCLRAVRPGGPGIGVVVAARSGRGQQQWVLLVRR
ncbi:hypothetical protein KPATCC21470_8454 [Kitasatospora purpeofusca]